MKIDIGTTGKILGTKRVSNNGQISGFTEYAGLEVLVILPGEDRPRVQRDAKDVLGSVETVVREQMDLAFRQYAEFRRRFKTPERAAEAFLSATGVRNLPGLLDRADRWIKEQVGSVERKIQKRLGGPEGPGSRGRKKAD